MAIYIIETGFWINKKIIQLLTTIVYNSSGYVDIFKQKLHPMEILFNNIFRNAQATIGLCIFIGFMIIAFLLGGIINSSTLSSSC